MSSDNFPFQDEVFDKKPKAGDRFETYIVWRGKGKMLCEVVHVTDHRPRKQGGYYGSGWCKEVREE
jgi:hypothetical protein